MLLRNVVDISFEKKFPKFVTQVEIINDFNNYYV